jgi:hypothetical protein
MIIVSGISWGPYHPNALQQLGDRWLFIILSIPVGGFAMKVSNLLHHKYGRKTFLKDLTYTHHFHTCTI